MAETITFLFGAGASKGAVHVDPCAPPVGKELYDRLAHSFPREWGPGSPLSQYCDGFRNDFENTMSKEISTQYAPLFILEWMRPMSLYFSRFTPDKTGKDLYTRLLLCLQAKGLIGNSIFGSLNYDCIFEKAAHRIGFKINYSGKKAKIDAISVLKVHGSCNFVTEDMESKSQYLSGYTESQIDYVSLQDIETELRAKFFGSAACHYPFVSLYAFGKNTIVGGREIQKIRTAWSQTVSSTSLLAIIGVKPNKDDSHIWDPVKKTSARLLYIGSQTDFAAWLSANSRFKHLGSTFELGFDNLIKSLASD